MPTKISKHATERMQQRGIAPMVVDWLLDFGVSEPSGKGTRRYFFDKGSKRRLKKHAGAFFRDIEPHLNAYLVEADDQTIVTVSWRTERIRRN